MSPPSTSSRLPKSSVSTLAPEPKTSLARITPGGQAGDEDDRDDAVGVLLPARPRAAVAGAEGERRGEGAERRREAEAVGEHQAREGGGADRVREEGQPAEDDPGAEQAGGDGEDQDLDQAALDEGELEGLEQGRASLVRMSLVCSKTGDRQISRMVLVSRPYGERWAPLALRANRRWSAQRSSASNDSPSPGKTARPSEARGVGVRRARFAIGDRRRDRLPHAGGALAVRARCDHRELVAADPASRSLERRMLSTRRAVRRSTASPTGWP